MKRRKRDLNPRAALTRPTPLAGAPLQPLEYFSRIINLYEVDASQRMSYYTHNVLSCQLLFSFFAFSFFSHFSRLYVKTDIQNPLPIYCLLLSTTT